MLLSGNAVLSDGPNLTRGERIVYDLKTGIATVETAPGGRVRAMFTPGGGATAAPAAPAATQAVTVSTLPSTGAGAEDGGAGLGALAALAVLAVIGGGGTALARRRSALR